MKAIIKKDKFILLDLWMKNYLLFVTKIYKRKMQLTRKVAAMIVRVPYFDNLPNFMKDL
jgi:hypothetical protein